MLLPSSSAASAVGPSKPETPRRRAAASHQVARAVLSLERVVLAPDVPDGASRKIKRSSRARSPSPGRTLSLVSVLPSVVPLGNEELLSMLRSKTSLLDAALGELLTSASKPRHASQEPPMQEGTHASSSGRVRGSSPAAPARSHPSSRRLSRRAGGSSAAALGKALSGVEAAAEAQPTAPAQATRRSRRRQPVLPAAAAAAAATAAAPPATRKAPTVAARAPAPARSLAAPARGAGTAAAPAPLAAALPAAAAAAATSTSAPASVRPSALRKQRLAAVRAAPAAAAGGAVAPAATETLPAAAAADATPAVPTRAAARAAAAAAAPRANARPRAVRVHRSSDVVTMRLGHLQGRTVLGRREEAELVLLAQRYLTLDQAMKQATAVLKRQPTLEELASLVKVEDSASLPYALSSGKEALDLLLKHNARLVVATVNRYRGMFGVRSVPFADLLDEGTLGLVRAIKTFEPARGFKLSTYATTWILNHMQRAARKMLSIVGMPTQYMELYPRYLKHRQQLREELGKEPTLEQVAVRMKRVRAATLHTMLATLPSVLAVGSLDAMGGTDSDGEATAGDQALDVDADDVQLAGGEEPNGLDMVQEALMAEDLQRLLEKLPPRERYAVMERYGLSYGQVCPGGPVGLVVAQTPGGWSKQRTKTTPSFAATSRALGMSGEACRTMVKQAIETMRGSLESGEVAAGVQAVGAGAVLGGSVAPARGTGGAYKKSK